MEEQNALFSFHADPASSTPPWLQLRKRIAHLIETGVLKPGNQLPKIRELAVEVSMNFNTVNKAYLSLRSDGYLTSIRGKGVFVADPLPCFEAKGDGNLQAVVDEYLHTLKSMGVAYGEAAELVASRAKMLTMIESIPYHMPGTNVIVMGDDSRLNENTKGA